MEKLPGHIIFALVSVVAAVAIVRMGAEKRWLPFGITLASEIGLLVIYYFTMIKH